VPTKRSLRLEALEPRVLLSATLIEPFDDLPLAVNPSNVVLDLAETFDDPDYTGTVVEFDTVLGTVLLELYDNDAPATVANFLNYLDRGDYSMSVVHRSVLDFVVQGGGYWYPSWDQIPQDPPIANEPGISNTRGTIAMARQPGDPDSATSQWFINVADNTFLDTQDGGFAVFGHVIDGMDVVDAINALPTYDFGSPFDDLPLRDYTDYPTEPVDDDNVVLILGAFRTLPLTFEITNDNPDLVTATLYNTRLHLQVAPDQTGEATITVRATDLGGSFVEDSFTLSVHNPPVAQDDQALTDNDQPVAIAVLSNDTPGDLPFDPAAVTITDEPDHGTAVLDPATGIVTYSPEPGYFGPDAFTYVAADTNGLTSNEAAVSIIVNAAPVLVTPLDDLAIEQGDPDTVLDLSGLFDDPDITGTLVRFNSVMGDFVFELYDDAAPQNVANFLNYVNRGDYSGSIIHRSIADFVVQGGGFWYPSWQPIPEDDPVVNEPGISNTRGTVAMAKVPDDPDSATSQWFINVADNSFLDSQNGGFTVFAHVIEGMDVVDAINALPTYDFADPFADLPLRDYTGYPDAIPGDDNVVYFSDVSVIPAVALSVEVDNPGLLDAALDGAQLTLSYVPGAWGVATVTVRGTDLKGSTIEEAFTVTVTGPPLAAEDAANTDPGQAVVVDVLANDQTQGQPLAPATVQVVVPPTNGTAVVDPATGAITYSPPDGFVGPETFTYTVQDVEGRVSEPAVVTVLVRSDGVVIGDGFPRAVRYTDADGTIVTIALRGGAARVRFVGYPDLISNGPRTIEVGGHDVGVYLIELSNTTPRSSLTFSTRGGTERGTEIGQITGDDPVGRITGSQIDLTGAGITLTDDGYVGYLRLRNLANGADIVMPGNGATRGLTIYLGVVEDPGTDIIVASPIRYLRAVQWVGSQLSAPWVASLRITGSRSLGLPGDLGVDVDLDGAGATTYVLRSAVVAGALSRGTWEVNGAIGSIRAGSAAAEWSLDAEGYVRSLYVSGSLGGTVVAPWFGRITARGELRANITAEGADARGISISSLSSGLANGASVNAAGAIRYVRTNGWLGGGLRAASVGSLVASRKRSLGLNGDMMTNIILTGQAGARYTLRSASVAGFVGYSGWDITGDVGRISVRGDVGNWWCYVHSSIGSVRFGSVTNSSVFVEGPVRSVTVEYWGSGQLWAHSLGSLRATGNRREGVPARFTAALTLSGQGVPDGRPTLGSATFPEGVGAATWDITGDVRSIRAAWAQDWTLNVHSSLASLRVDYVASSSLNVEGEIRSVRTGFWENASLSAQAIRSASLGFVTNGNVTVDGTLRTLKVGYWHGGSLTAASIGRLDSIGDLRHTPGHFSADLTITGTADGSPALGRISIIGTLYDSTWNVTGEIDYLYVKYWVNNTQVRASGDIEQALFGGMDSSVLYAGVADGVMGLVDPTSGFSGQATIERLTIRGIPFSRGIYEVFINSNVAASSLGAVDLNGVKIYNDDHNNEAFGVSSLAAGSLTWKQGGVSYRWPTRLPATTGDFQIRVAII